jgi:tetratricopeptide (TPR) repeat protein
MPLFPLVWRPRFTFFLPAFLVLPLWFGEQLLYGTTEARASGVGWWAHIGGFALGAVLALLVRLVRLEERVINPSIEKEISFEQHPGLEAALDFHARGQREAAGRAIQEVLAAQPDNIDAWRVAYDLAVDAGDGTAAGRAAVRFLEISLRQGQHDLLPSFVEEALGAERPLPVRFYLTAARHFEKSTDVHQNLALRLYAELAERHSGDPAAFRAEYRRGEILRRSDDPEAARRAFTRARAHPACTGELRDMVDRQIAAVDSSPGRPRPAR